MKRKLFSTILFGALLTASTSGLTSCKDYDDDISNLQSQIDKLATAEQLSTKVSELQTAIAAAQSAAESKAAAAQTVADAAKAAAADAAAAASKAQGAADDAAKAAAAAAEVGKAAQAAVDKLAAEAATKADLEAAAQAAQAAVEAIKAEHATDKAEIEAAIETGLAEVKADIAATNEKLAALAARLDTVEAKLAALEAGEGQEETLAAIQAEVEDIVDVLESLGITISEMVTAVHLFRPSGDADFTSNNLTFAQVKELVDLKFPANGEADGYAEFKKDAYKMYGDSLVVRVSPIEAELKPENITLINSQGAEVSSDVLEVTDVVRYTRKPLTRAAENANGLWVVKFKVADEVKAEDFEKIAGKNELGKKVLFAVAVNNTDEVSGSRRVISDYDVTLAYGNAVASSNLFVNGISIYGINNPALSGENVQYANGIHNRFNFTEDWTPLPSAVKGKDKMWKKDRSGNFIPALEVVEDPANYEADNRDGRNVLLVKEGEDIAISYPSNQPIKGFYVALDWTRACESGESELNAWNSYKYENVAKFAATGVLIEAGKFFEGNNGTIKVAALSEAQRLAGDIIGFRVFAVNLDGTLVDPDGQAFYVGIQGSETTDNVELAAAEAVVTKVASQANGKNWTGAIDFAPAKEGLSNVSLGTWTVEGAPQGANTTFTEGTHFDVITLDKDGNTNNIPVKDIVAVKIQLKDPTAFVDGATYTFKTTLKKNVSGSVYTVRNVAVKVTKKMPGVPTNIKFSGDEDKYQPMYASAYDGIRVANIGTTTSPNYGNSTPQTGLLKLGTFLVYDNATNAPIDSYSEYSYTISKAKYSWEGTPLAWKLKADEVKNTSVPAWNLSVESKAAAAGATDKYTYLVDCSTTHTITSNYNYGYISYKLNNAGTAYVVDEWKPNTPQTPEVVFMSWASQNSGFTTYKIAKYSNDQTGKDYKDCTFNEVVWAGLNSPIAIDAISNAAWTTAPTSRRFSLNNVRVKFGLKVLNMAGQPFSRNGSLGSLLKNGYLKLVAAWTEVPAADGSVAKNKFIEPTVNGTNDDITLKQVANTSSDHTEILKLQVVDCFNYKQVIEVPISVVTSLGAVQNVKEITFN